MARYAAVDIGSNSVRMLAAEVVPGAPIRTLAEDREVTRLGASVFKSGNISTDAVDAVCAVLRRMAAAYSKLDVLGVRAVATSAVRDASNQEDFIQRASEAVGAQVEIISGQEEARLIHMGVQSRWPHPDGKVLIIDVGGGSGEFIVSEKGDLKEGVSRPLGAVRLTEVFLKADPPGDVEIARMLRFIDEKFEPAHKRLQSWHFDRVIGTSATAAAIVSAINRVPRSDRDVADRLRARTPQVRRFFKDVASRDLAARRKVHGIGPRRAEIIVAGSAVFLRVLESLGLDAFHYSRAGVRDGVIADLEARGVGRELSRLSRQQVRVMELMCRKYNVDVKYARHVAGLAGGLFDAMHPFHKLAPEFGRILQSAAYLHDTGHYISDTGHHKHSSYIVQNSDMPGYTDAERQLVAMLCRYHRKSMPTARHEPYRAMPTEARRALLMLAPLLRLAVALDTAKEQKVQGIQYEVAAGTAKVMLQAERDPDLEIWAAERAADIIRQVYGITVNIEKART
jgi:exopolyphosphatase/guanosine-5'-triphosphate,3'-diphosphate pyrophosphatase